MGDEAMWPDITGARFMEILRHHGWTITVEGDRWWANKERGAVKVRLKFTPETELYSRDVERWADNFGLTLLDF